MNLAVHTFSIWFLS